MNTLSEFFKKTEKIHDKTKKYGIQAKICVLVSVRVLLLIILAFAAFCVFSDTQPPRIICPEVIFVSEGSSVKYRDKIRVADDRSAEDAISVKIDTSEVNINSEGKYGVTVCATDKAGNTTRKTLTVNVDKIRRYGEVYDKVGRIIKERGMDAAGGVQTIVAVCDYVRLSLDYAPVEHDGLLYTEAAYEGLFTTHKGDCFYFFPPARCFSNCSGLKMSIWRDTEARRAERDIIGVWSRWETHGFTRTAVRS